MLNKISIRVQFSPGASVQVSTVVTGSVTW